jgi:hypothetical protein
LRAVRTPLPVTRGCAQGEIQQGEALAVNWWAMRVAVLVVVLVQPSQTRPPQSQLVATAVPKLALEEARDAAPSKWLYHRMDQWSLSGGYRGTVCCPT